MAYRGFEQDVLQREQTLGEIKLVEVEVALEELTYDSIEHVAEERPQRRDVLENVHKSDDY